MQKRLLTMFWMMFFVAIGSSAFGETIKPDSKITDVTVYPDSALVKRMASLSLAKGEHQIIFSDIIPDIDENSLNVAGKGEAQVKIFGVQIKREFLTAPPSEEVKKLEADIEAVKDQIDGKNNHLEVLAKEKDFLDSIKLTADTQIPKDLMTKFPNVTDLESLSKFLVAKFDGNENQRQETNVAIRELTRKKEALERQLLNLNSGNQKMRRFIVVDLESEKPGNFNLAVSYLVRNVSWNPLYDARTSFEQSKVELVFFGVLRQSTGEPWEDVRLFLSTAKPSVGGKMPELHPWYLRPYEYKKERGGMLASKAVGYMAPRSDQDYLSTDLNGEEWGATQQRDKSATMVYATAEEKGTAVVYEVKRKATIKPDGTDHKVPISSQNLEADFQYAATPKLSPYAYLMSKIKNSKEGQLLPGMVNIFFEGDYIGLSNIPKSIGAEESFDLYLGIDEGITVKRKKLEEKVDETLIANIPSPTKTISYSYKLIVENYKNKKIKVSLYDQIPISEDDRIAVKKVQFSAEPAQKNYFDRKGVMRWDFELEPKQKKEITLFYVIEHPRDLNVSGL